ncbi:MAG TPA: TolC family protein [Planctomycetaceae bacterium]|nr:TolC family protein [Planctomycetaceae bacterium]
MRLPGSRRLVRWHAMALCSLGLGCAAAGMHELELTSGDAPAPAAVQLASAEVPPPPADSDVQAEALGDGVPVVSGPGTAPAAGTGDGRIESPIDFESALALAAGRNPQVAFANERIREAFARLRQAEALWLPTINAGANYNKHEGTIQNVEGEIIDASRQSIYAGLGARAVGAGSPASPGLVAAFHTSDAVFQPRIERRATAARQYAATAAINDTLLNVSLAYLDLLAAYQRQTIADETLANARDLARLTADFAETGQGNQADADRARAELAVRQNEAHRAGEAIDVASARLTQLLSQPGGTKLVPREPSITPVELVDVSTPLNELLATGLSNRPELAETSFLVAQAVERLRREEHAVWLPSVLLGASYGTNGGGLGSAMDDFDDRWDVDAAVWWQVRNLGVGEKAARDEARSLVNQARWRQVQALDQVAAEIASAHAQVQARALQIETARGGISAALDSYDRNRARIREGQGLPLEVLQSLQALDQARREYLRAVSDYNEAQFRLHRALGWPVVAPGEGVPM